MYAQEGLQGSPKRLPRSTATSPKRSLREVTVPRSPKVESQLYTNWTPLQSPNAASPTKLVSTKLSLMTLCGLRRVSSTFCAAAKLKNTNRCILKAFDRCSYVYIHDGCCRGQIVLGRLQLLASWPSSKERPLCCNR